MIVIKILFFSPGYSTKFFLTLAKRLKKEEIVIDVLIPKICYTEVVNASIYDSVYQRPSSANFKEEDLNLDLIASYERKYGDPSFWSAVYCDRHINHYYAKKYYHKEKIDHNYYLRSIQYYVQFIEKMLDKAKIDYLLMLAPSNLFAYLLFLIARKKGVQPLILGSTRIGKRYTLSYEPKVGFERILDRFSQLRSSKSKSKYVGDARNFLRNFREKYGKPGYEETNKTFGKRKNSSAHVFGKFPKAARELLKDPNMFFDYLPVISEIARKHVFWKKIGSGVFEKGVDGEQFVLFPLHLEPELATMLKAPMYIDQIPLIENIAKSLPVTYKLYVKEHPMMLYSGNAREDSYYEKIKKIPNVRLISPLADTRKLIQNSKLVTVIGGTMGMEAAFFKKPCIKFTRTFYDVLESVDYCRDINKLPELISSKLKNQKYSDVELIDLLSAIYEHSFEFDMDYYAILMASPPKDFLNDFKFEGLCSALLAEVKRNI